jgi:hypothetical protein
MVANGLFVSRSKLRRDAGRMWYVMIAPTWLDSAICEFFSMQSPFAGIRYWRWLAISSACQPATRSAALCWPSRPTRTWSACGIEPPPTRTPPFAFGTRGIHRSIYIYIYIYIHMYHVCADTFEDCWIEMVLYDGKYRC